MRPLLMGFAGYIALVVSNNPEFHSYLVSSGSTTALLVNACVTALLGYVFGTFIATWASKQSEKEMLQQAMKELGDDNESVNYDDD